MGGLTTSYWHLGNQIKRKIVVPSKLIIRELGGAVSVHTDKGYDDVWRWPYDSPLVTILMMIGTFLLKRPGLLSQHATQAFVYTSGRRDTLKGYP